MTLYGTKKKRARKKKVSSKKKTTPKKLARKAKTKLSKRKSTAVRRPQALPKKRSPKKRSASPKVRSGKRAVKKSSTKRAAVQTASVKRAAAARARKAAERKAELARERRNAARREARAEARAKELKQLLKKERDRKARALARKKARAVNVKQHKLRLEAEKLRLRKPRTTKKKVREARAVVNAAVAAPPIVVEYTEHFNTLFKLAKKSNQLPHIDYRRRIIDTQVSKGRERTVRVEALVSEENLEEILWKAKKAAAQITGFRIWLATLIMSSMGPEIVGSGGRVLVSNHALSFKFQTEAYYSTGVFNTPQGMLAAIEEKLDKVATSEKDSLVFLHAIRIQNFTRKAS